MSGGGLLGTVFQQPHIVAHLVGGPLDGTEVKIPVGQDGVPDGHAATYQPGANEQIGPEEHIYYRLASTSPWYREWMGPRQCEKAGHHRFMHESIVDRLGGVPVG